MQSTRTPRIVIEDLAALETLTQEELAHIYGAGRFRPMLEALEDRMLMSASALSNLPIPGTHTAPTVNFTLGANMDLKETIGKSTKDLGSAAGGQLFQGHDAAGHEVVYLAGNGHLYEFTPNSGFGTFTQIGIPNNNEIIQDKSLGLFFLQGSTLFEATGVPTTSSAAAHLLTSNVQAVSQARDTTGHLEGYTSKGGQLYQVSGSGLQQVKGLTGVIQTAIDGKGQLYALESNGTLFSVNGTTAVKSATGVTQMGVDSAGEVLVLQGPHAYTYFSPNGLADSGGGIASNPAGLPQYAMGPQAQLYTLLDNKLSVQATSLSTPKRIASDAVQMVTTGSWNIVYVSATGNVWQSQGTGWATIGVGGKAAPDGSIWYLGTSFVSGGNRTIYHLTNYGSAAAFGSFAQILGVEGTTVWVADAKNNVYSSSVRGWLQMPSPIAAKWLESGGATGSLGLPTSGLQGVPGGSVIRFQNEAIFESSATGNCVLMSSAILNKWLALQQAGTKVGIPVQDVTQALDPSGNPQGRIQLFQFGQIYAPTTGTVQFYALPSSSGLGLWGGISVSQIRPNSIEQDKAGTCSFLSALSSVARTDPTLLADHITQNFDGTWRVTLFNAATGKWQPIQVSLTSFNSGDPMPGPNNAYFWTAVFQRAYLQLMNVDTTNSNPGLWSGGSWQNIGVALQALTGTAAVWTPSGQASWQAIQTALQQGKNVEAGTMGATDHSMIAKAPGLVGDHSYTVVNIIPPPAPGSLNIVDAPQEAQVVLRNPWGFDPSPTNTAFCTQAEAEPAQQADGKSDGYITIPWSEFKANFTGYYIDSNS